MQNRISINIVIKLFIIIIIPFLACLQTNPLFYYINLKILVVLDPCKRGKKKALRKRSRINN